MVVVVVAVLPAEQVGLLLNLQPFGQQQQEDDHQQHHHDDDDDTT